jgi:hypothetical protein
MGIMNGGGMGGRGGFNNNQGHFNPAFMQNGGNIPDGPRKRMKVEDSG